jgi:hypothetical protein
MKRPGIRRAFLFDGYRRLAERRPTHPTNLRLGLGYHDLKCSLYLKLSPSKKTLPALPDFPHAITTLSFPKPANTVLHDHKVNKNRKFQ